MATVRLTPHQRDILRELVRRSYRPTDSETGPGRWVDARDIGARAALDHLTRKGYAERRIEHGPRGGQRPFYRPTRGPVA